MFDALSLLIAKTTIASSNIKRAYHSHFGGVNGLQNPRFCCIRKKHCKGASLKSKGRVVNLNGIEHTKVQFYLHIEITATIADTMAIAKVHFEIIKDFFKIRSFVLRESSFFPMLIKCSTSSIFETIPF